MKTTNYNDKRVDGSVVAIGTILLVFKVATLELSSV
jgi:hypothetical protein